MKSDVPGLEACKRLAKAGWTNSTFFRYDKDDDEGEWVLCQAAGKWRPAYAVDAPTIGEMLAKIRRRGWYAWVDSFGNAEVKDGDHMAILGKSCVPDRTADALALALTVALEKEGAVK